MSIEGGEFARVPVLLGNAENEAYNSYIYPEAGYVDQSFMSVTDWA